MLSKLDIVTIIVESPTKQIFNIKALKKQLDRKASSVKFVVIGEEITVDNKVLYKALTAIQDSILCRFDIAENHSLETWVLNRGKLKVINKRDHRCLTCKYGNGEFNLPEKYYEQ